MIKGKFNYKELEKFQKRIEKLGKGTNELNAFLEECAKELAARLLPLVIARTPRQDSVTYTDADGKTKVFKNGGTLIRGWTAKTEKEAESGNTASVKSYVQSLEVNKNGNIYTIEVVNPVHYASYVEYGHRQEVGRYVPAIGKKLVNAWVDGKKMLTISEMELENITPQILEKKIKKFLEGYFNGD